MVTNSQAGLWFYPHFPSFRWEALWKRFSKLSWHKSTNPIPFDRKR